MSVYVYLIHGRTADALCYVLPPKKYGDLIVMNCYISKCLDFQKKLIDTNTAIPYRVELLHREIPVDNTGNEFTEYNFLLFWLHFFPCFINVEIVALVPVMCTGNCQFILQGLKACFTVVCKIVHKIASVWCKTALGEVGVSLP